MALNFLDITIKQDQNKPPIIETYRPPTLTDLILPVDSNHPHNYKSVCFYIHEVAVGVQ